MSAVAPSSISLPEVEEGRPLAHPRRLLHRVGDDDDGVVRPQLVDQLLDHRRRDRVERGGRLVHQEHVGPCGDRPRDAQPLLLPAGQAGARLAQPVLDLVPQSRPPERGLDQRRELRLVRASARGCAARRRRSRRSTSGTGSASGTPSRPARAARPRRRRGSRRRPRRAGSTPVTRHDRDGVVHPVDAAQEGRLPAARRPDQRRHLVRRDVEAHPEQRLLLPVEDLDAARRHLDLRRRERRRPALHRRGHPSAPTRSARAGGAATRRARSSRSGTRAARGSPPRSATRSRVPGCPPR